jgi:predicted SprT family Zn-dependent metalloprotease
MDKTNDSANATQGQQLATSPADLPYSSERATEQQYSVLQQAYDFYNERLFGGMLPPCLITLQRRHNTRGYHSPGAFINADGKVTDEIALNPAYFAFRGIEESLSTLAHEMTHLWQTHFGTRPRAGYHSRAWADKMIEIGLVPSETGAEGGAQTGDRVTHYISQVGPFLRHTQELLAGGFALRWYDRFPERAYEPAPAPPPAPLEADKKIKGSRKREIPAPPRHVATVKPGEALQAMGVNMSPRQSIPRAGKARYVCSHCNAHVWGKSKLNLLCRDCNQDFVEG